MSEFFRYFPVIGFTCTIILLLVTGCTSISSGFSGIYLLSEDSQDYLEFRTDGSIYSTRDGEYKEIGKWKLLDENLLQVCYPSYCRELGIRDDILFYSQNGKENTLKKIDRIPEQTPTQSSVKTTHTSASSWKNNMRLEGVVYGYASSNDAQSLDYIMFTIQSFEEKSSVEVSDIIVTYADSKTSWPAYTFESGISESTVSHSAKWGISKVGGDDCSGGSTVLKHGCEYTLKMGVPATATPDMKFQVVLTTPDNSQLPISRTVTHTIDKINVIY